MDVSTFVTLVITGFASGLGSALANYILLEHFVKALRREKDAKGE